MNAQREQHTADVHRMQAQIAEQGGGSGLLKNELAASRMHTEQSEYNKQLKASVGAFEAANKLQQAESQVHNQYATKMKAMEV